MNPAARALSHPSEAASLAGGFRASEVQSATELNNVRSVRMISGGFVGLLSTKDRHSADFTL